MWPTALRKCKRDDYKNASNVQVDGSKYFWLYHFVKTAHLMLIVNLPYSSSDDSNNASQSTNCPNEFYQMMKKKPKDDRRRYAQLLEVATALCNDAVNKGDEDTFVHTFARLMQARKECNDMI